MNEKEREKSQSSVSGGGQRWLPILQAKAQDTSLRASQAQVDGTKDCELHP